MIPVTIRTAVREFATTHAILRPGPLVVAVSGGTDSTALLLLLAALRDELGLVLHVAHFDHRARPGEAAADAQHVADLAARCGATFRAGRADHPARSEDDARVARYAFLRRAAEAVGATAIATGHTRDDQAETVLLHLTRGSGLAGLAGMRPQREGIVRPLLAIGRAETAAVCAAEGIVPREDPTNRSLRFARNRVRRRVLPELGRINTRVTDALARTAEVAAAADATLDRLARELLESARDGAAIRLEALGADATLRDRALAIAWELGGGPVLDGAQRSALGALAASHDGTARIDLPGGSAVREYGRLRFGAPDPAPMGEETVRALLRGAEVEWRGWQLVVSDERPSSVNQFITGVPDGLADLAVRGRRPGDRLDRGVRTVGRKVQDVLVDAKVPRALRDEQPLVVTRDGGIFWVVGLAGGTAPGANGPWLGARPPAGERHSFWSSRVPGNSIGR